MTLFYMSQFFSAISIHFPFNFFLFIVHAILPFVILLSFYLSTSSSAFILLMTFCFFKIKLIFLVFIVDDFQSYVFQLTQYHCVFRMTCWPYFCRIFSVNHMLGNNLPRISVSTERRCGKSHIFGLLTYLLEWCFNSLLRSTVWCIQFSLTSHHLSSMI